ncbi:MAG: 4Fe-4S double cluster binding domain-containing protein [Clostridia bacterium]
MNTANVLSEPFSSMPNISSVILLIYPYSPFETEYSYIPSYYLNSNKAFFATKEFEKALNTEGVPAMSLNLPARAVALSSKVGSVGKNALLRVKDFGSRIILTTVGIENLAPLTYDETMPPCKNCEKCKSACPVNAIDAENGIYIQKCMRYHMETADHPEWVNANIKTFLGCEVCMDACPFNSKVERICPSPEVISAFDIDKLASGDTKAARELVGKNKTGNGKLTKEAISILKNLEKRRG